MRFSQYKIECTIDRGSVDIDEVFPLTHARASNIVSIGEGVNVTYIWRPNNYQDAVFILVNVEETSPYYNYGVIYYLADNHAGHKGQGDTIQEWFGRIVTRRCIHQKILKV